MDGRTEITLAVIFYNQEAFVEDAVRGALGQSYSPLEIVLSDDGSSDETFATIQRAVEGYHGPHKVILNRNEKNLGLAGHVGRVMELASGEFILFAGGDDISMPHRVTRAAEVLESEPDCLGISFGAIEFKDTPNLVEREDRSEAACSRYTMSDYVSTPFFHLHGATRAYRRRVFDFFGPIAADCPTEDSVMLLRCFLLGDVLATPEPQVHYRLHEGGLSRFGNIYRIDPALIHQQYLRDIAVAVEHGLLAEDDLEQLTATLDLRLERRTVQRKVFNSSSRVDMVRTIAGSRVFDGREKRRILLSAMKPRRRS